VKTKTKIILRIVIAVVAIVVCALIVIFLIPLDKPEDKTNLIVGVASAIAIFTVFSIFAMVQDGKKMKK